MKNIVLVFLLASCAACDNNSAVVSPESEPVEETTGSFRVGRGEIGTEIIEEMEKQGIEFWRNEDGSIGYFLADGDAIDAIAYYARGKYAARN